MLAHRRFRLALPLLLITAGAIDAGAVGVHELHTPVVTMDAATPKTQSTTTSSSSNSESPSILGPAASSCRIGAQLASENSQFLGVGTAVCLIGVYFGFEDFLGQYGH